MKKEFFVFIVIFFILSLAMHYKEFFSYPLEHIMNLSSAGAYGLGMIHPLIFTFIIYLLIWIPRFIFKLFKTKV